VWRSLRVSWCGWRSHDHLEAIHAIRDGNGRVGGILLPLMLGADGVVPLYLQPYIEAHKQQYYDALKVAEQRREHEAIIGYLSDAISGTVHEIQRTCQALAPIKTELIARRSFRAGSAAVAEAV
jgi:Fic family protein